MRNYIPNSVCIVQVNFIVMSSGNIFGIYVKDKKGHLCFQFSGWGICDSQQYILYIFLYNTKKKPAYQSLLSLHFIKKATTNSTEGPLSKGFLLQKFHATLFREYHQTYSTPTQTHTGSDLDIRQDSTHFSSYFKSNSILELCLTLVSKHDSRQADMCVFSP